ncbi:response regulator [Pseudomonas sp. PDM23]|uniref:ATP-binding protein n=1 Tax=unclassified Pseudomonas TaxID=196821 RepID=UPI0017829151|nr:MULTISPECIES: PAS domain-containing sensor histidine kinase [unclassified Pseudomonas]MBD9504847.1 response regulator [Pseudomonas sp. PDM17]MBD9579295.1 response regulator [Pseudomonas sp. PDM23]MBD9672720.1 response regulator [Pseudomonas sp. PDM21]
MPSSPGETPISPVQGQGDFLNSSSAMAPLIRQYDWATTPLGPMDQWPATLKGILEVGLNSRLPVCIYWGPEFILLYNDAWSAIPGDKHPACLGQPAHVAWSDIWSILDPMYNGILQTGVAAHEEDRLLPMVRFGYVEEAYFTYNVSPIFGQDGKPIGLFNTAVETTGNVIEQRRQRLLTRLAERLGQADDSAQICALAFALLAEASHDVPFCLLYHAGTLLGACGTDTNDHFAPAQLTLDDDPLHLFGGIKEAHQSPLGSQHMRAFAPWPEVLDSTYATPLDGHADSLAVFGISPRRRLDENYATFFNELAALLGHALSAASQRTEERRLKVAVQEEARQRTRERDRVWTVSQDLLCVLDHQGVLLNVNPAWGSLLGWSEEQLTGRNSEELVHPDDLAPSIAIRSTLARGERLQHFENRLRHADGSYRWISWHATEENGVIYGCGRDITEQKRGALLLEQAQTALLNAQRMEAVGQLTGGIAHDFNNLLASIRFSLDLITRRAPANTQPELSHILHAATQATERAAELTHNLLAFARRQALAMHPVNLGQQLRNWHDELVERAGPDVTLALTLDDTQSVLTDRDQLHKAMLHLVENARDAMPGGGSLEISLRRQEIVSGEHDLPAGDYLALSLQDSGQGMSQATLTHVFDPFFTTKGIGPNSGLGLSMVYGFIKQSGGHIRLRSEPGQGTCVTLYFPRGTSVVSIPDAPTPPNEPANEQLCVLVVEDNDLVRMLTVEVLEEIGYQVLQAEDAEEALSILQGDTTIHLLLTDVGLPGMNGEELAVAAREARPELPILFATGYAEIVHIDGSELATRMSMIAKPFSIDALRDKVNGMLRRKDG